MDQTTSQILNQVFDIYSGSVINLEAGGITIAKELFYCIGTISIAVFGLNLLLRKNQDLADTHVALINHLIWLIFLYVFINNFGSILTTVYAWIQDTGNYLGVQAGHGSINKPVMSISPLDVFSVGIDVAKQMLTIPVSWNIFNDVLVAVFAVASAAAVLFCFAVIGLELILVQIGSQIILAGGIFLLAFAGLPWTREYAERYVHTFFHLGIKMIFIYVLVGIGMSLSQNWHTVLGQADQKHIINTYMAVAVASYVYYKLCTKLPDQAVSWLTGRLAMGFDTATDVKGAMAAPKKVYEEGKKLYEGYQKAGEWVSEIKADSQGNAQAVQAANQAARASLEAQGKTPSPQDIQKEAIKTLGEAKSSIRQAAWDKKVGGTQGGKAAQLIIDMKPSVMPSEEE